MNNAQLKPEKAKLKEQIKQLKKAEYDINKTLASCRPIAEEFGDKNSLNTISALTALRETLETTLQSILMKNYMED